MNPAEEIRRLRQAGFEVDVTHVRRQVAKEGSDRILLPRGGKTKVTILRETEAPGVVAVEATGVANCSDRENYNRRLGLQIALGRALKQFHKSVKVTTTESTKPEGAERNKCDECGAAIPDESSAWAVNRHHKQTCSLYDRIRG